MCFMLFTSSRAVLKAGAFQAPSGFCDTSSDTIAHVMVIPKIKLLDKWCRCLKGLTKSGLLESGCELVKRERLKVHLGNLILWWRCSPLKMTQNSNKLVTACVMAKPIMHSKCQISHRPTMPPRSKTKKNTSVSTQQSAHKVLSSPAQCAACCMIDKVQEKLLAHPIFECTDQKSMPPYQESTP